MAGAELDEAGVVVTVVVAAGAVGWLLDDEQPTAAATQANAAIATASRPTLEYPFLESPFP